jgi:hypothetical protein
VRSIEESGMIRTPPAMSHAASARRGVQRKRFNPLTLCTLR